jgi:VanZ family protein
MKLGTVILALWTLVLLALLLLPIHESLIPNLGVPQMDKVAHFGLFAVTGFLSIYGASFLSSYRSRLFFGLIFGLVLSIGTELGQHFVPYRDMDFFDLLADWAGLFFGLFANTFIHSWKLNL